MSERWSEAYSSNVKDAPWRQTRSMSYKHWIVTSLAALAPCALCLCSMLSAKPADATLPDVIVLSPGADDLESFAAQEVQRYLYLLYGHKPRIVLTAAPEELSGTSFLVLGQPSKSTLVRDLSKEIEWSQSDQTYALVPSRLHDKIALIVAGASAPAVLWGAYQLIEKLGCPFRPGWRPPSYATHNTPMASQRYRPPTSNSDESLTGHNLHVEGPASWGIDDYCKFLDQAAKLRFNGYMFMLRDMGPWYGLEFKGIRKTKADIYGGGWQKALSHYSRLDRL